MKKFSLFFGFLAASATWLLGETIVLTSLSNQTQSITITVPYCADVMVHGAASGPPNSYITGNTPIGSFYRTPSDGYFEMTGTVQAGTYTIYENVGTQGFVCVVVMLHPPPPGPYPAVGDSDAWSTGGMADFYYQQYGASQFDMALWWSPGAHDALLGHALEGRATPNTIDVLRAASRAFDRSSQATADSHKHSMRRKNQTVNDAITARDDFIRDTIAQARAAAMANDVPTALRLLGEALHPVMDYSSPMHTDGTGDPRIWRGIVRDGWGHSPNDTVGNERAQDITQQVYDLEDPIIRSYFVAVFRGTPAATTVFADGFDPNQVPNAVLPQNPP